MEKAKAKNVKIHLPTDFVAAEKYDKDAKHEVVSDKDGIKDSAMGLDIGPLSTTAFSSVLWKAKTVVYNGPMGVFEFPAFSHGTFGVLQAAAAATQIGGAISIIGGGDTASAAKVSGVSKFVTHVSTGGGASLELLEGKQLPGVAALTDKKSQNKSKL